MERNSLYKILFDREVANLKKIKSPNVVRYIDLTETQNEFGGDYILVMEYCKDGDLKKDLEK
jgi:serine/threonine protein kinase